MNTNKFKKIKHLLFWGGLGFATSSILGLDGFRDTMQLPQLFIGTGAILAATIVHISTTHRIN
ncbi:MAG: hypothetical protein RSA85_06175 [Cellulosilyticaceae bacterium]